MADRLGAAYHTYLKYERGVNFPNPLVMEYLLSKCNLSMDWLLFGRGPKHFIDKKEKEQLAGEASQLLETETSQLKQEVADLQKEVTGLKKESAGYLEEAAELKSKL
ncbi:MAG: hypothetical protein GY950_33490, partial [bacterium]|nr:hypothetical protein [bacterium]